MPLLYLHYYTKCNHNYSLLTPVVILQHTVFMVHGAGVPAKATPFCLMFNTAEIFPLLYCGIHSNKHHMIDQCIDPYSPLLTDLIFSSREACNADCGSRVPPRDGTLSENRIHHPRQTAKTCFQACSLQLLNP